MNRSILAIAVITVIAVFFAVFTGTLCGGVSSSAAVAAINSSNQPAPLTKGSDIVPLNGQSNMLQFTAGGHVLGFQPTKAYLASLDHALSVEFLGTKGVMPETTGAMPATGTLSGAPTLRRVLYQNLWEGISLTYESTQDGITESTYRIAPGADAAQIRLRYNVPVSAQKDGSLKLTFERGYLTESKPIAWQQINGKRTPVAVAFAVSGDEVGFSVGDYNPREPLIIDPTYTWHTFYGSSDKDYGWGIAVDASGNVYITGYSFASWGSPLHAHSGSQNLFVLKLDANGAYQWHTFYGPSNSDYAWTAAFIAVDASGNVYVTGESSASWGSPLHAYSGNTDVFVLKLNANGAYQWHTFYGSSDYDSRPVIAVDASGNVYITGESSASWGSPLNPKSGGNNLFVLKLNANGAYQWHTFYGSSDGEYGSGIAVDGSGNVYVTAGSSASWGAPLYPHNGNSDVFVLKLNANGAYEWHAFYGSSGYDAGYAIAVDTSGNVYITGTLSRKLAVLKLDANGAYQWHAFYGSSDYGSGYGIAINASGNVYVTGESWASWGDPLHAYSGDADIVVLKLDASGAYQWHTFYGLSGDDWGVGIGLDTSGNVYVTGASAAPSWGDPLHAHSGNYDVFVLKLNDSSTVSETVSTPYAPSGATTGTTGISNVYSTGGSSSSLGSAVQYQFDWIGDGVTSLSSWGAASQSKAWAAAGSYNVRARARSVTNTNVVSAWSNPINVNITSASYTLTVNVTGSGSVIKNPNQAQYTSGAVVQLTAVPATGYVFSGWSGNLTGNTNPASLTMNANKTVTATFVQAASYTLTVNVTGSGSVTTNPNQAQYTSGAVVQLTAVPAAGYVFSGWSGDLTGNTNPASLTMNANKNVTATFVQAASYTLTVNVTGSGSVTKNPNQAQYTSGAVVRLTAVPAAGYVFNGWSGDLTGNTNPASLTMNANKTVTAAFVQAASYSYTVTTIPSGGQVSVDGVTYVTPKTFNGVAGSTHTLSVPSPQQGTSGTRYVFNSWSDGGAQTHSITVPSSNTTYTVFADTQYSLTTSATSGGTVSPSGTNWYNSGQVVSISATAKTGYSFSNWSGSLSGSTNPSSITMTGPKSVTANFK